MHKYERNIILNKIDDNQIEEKCIEFFNYLEEDFNNFCKKINQYKNNEKIEKEKNKGNIKNNIFIFEPEALKIKSAFTIFNGFWGIGKTFFIENVCRLIRSGVIKNKIIKNIIYMDSLQFSFNSNIPDTFVIEILNKLKPVCKNISKKILDISGNLFSFALNGILGTKFDPKQLENINKKTQEELILSLNDEFKHPTLFIIDNIERLGKHSWDVIRSIQKLLILDNCIFLLPLNKEKIIYEINNSEKSEWCLQKYINIPMYNFRQSYYNILCKKIDNKNYVNSIINILNEPIDGQQLSIREINNYNFDNINNLFNKNKYLGLNQILTIWNNEHLFRKEITIDVERFHEKVKNVRSFKKEIYNLYSQEISNINKFINMIKDLYTSEFQQIENDTKNINSINQEIKNIIFFDKDEYIYNSLNNFFNNAAQILKNIKDLNIAKNNDIQKEINDINKNNDDLLKKLEDNQEFNRKIDNGEVKSNSKNLEKYSKNKIYIQKSNDIINKNKQRLNELNRNETEISNLIAFNNQFSETINKFFDIYKKYIENINQINNDNNEKIIYEEFIKLCEQNRVNVNFYQIYQNEIYDVNQIVSNIIINIKQIEE